MTHSQIRLLTTLLEKSALFKEQAVTPYLSNFIRPMISHVKVVEIMAAILMSLSWPHARAQYSPVPTLPGNYASVAPGSLDPVMVRRELLNVFVRNNSFRRDIQEMALPPELGLTRADIQDGVQDMMNLIENKPMTISYGGVSLQIAFTVYGNADHFIVSGNFFQQLIAEDDTTLFHECIHRTILQKRMAAQAEVSRNRLAESLRPYWSPAAKMQTDVDALDVLASGGWSQLALKDNPVLAADARIIASNLWHAEASAHYAELSLLNLWAQRQGLTLHAYLEQKLRRLAQNQGLSYEDYMHRLATPALGDPGLKWYTTLEMATGFNEKKLTPAFQDYILGQLIIVPARRWIVLGLMRVDLEPNLKIDLYQKLIKDLAFRAKFQEWARRTIWPIHPPLTTLKPTTLSPRLVFPSKDLLLLRAA